MDGDLPAAGLNTALFEQGVRKLFLGGLCYAVTTKNLYLGEDDIAEVAHLRERLIEFVDTQFDYMTRNARERLRNQRLFAEYDYKLISLGTDCLSRTLPTRWGLKPPKALGELTHPFDLAVHPYEAVCQVLDEDFATYLDTSFLLVNHRNYIAHKRLKIHFNHEIGETFTANDYEGFVEVYGQRIDNFRQDIKNFPVLFVIHMTSSHVPSELYRILTHRMGRDDWRLLVLNTSADAYDAAAVRSVPDRMILHHVPYPYPDFVWHVVPHITSPGGQGFERRVIAAVRQAIVENFRRCA